MNRQSFFGIIAWVAGLVLKQWFDSLILLIFRGVVPSSKGDWTDWGKVLRRL